MFTPRQSASARSLFMWTAILASCVMSSVTYGATTEAEREEFIRQALLTCGPINLLVEGLSRDAQKIGLTKASLESIAKSRLSAAGVHDPESIPYLYLNLNVVGRAYGLSIRFRQRIQNKLIGRRFATVWQLSGVGTHGGNADHIKNVLRDDLDSFMVEFLTVNDSDLCADIRRQKREAAR